MECNRDEAMKAKTIAEEKFNSNDFVSAKRFALKAQKLHPELYGISHMLRTLDVYIFSEMKINGEPDWCGVLGVEPSDDDETIKRRYMKLLVYIHPDKNRSVGARGAYDLITKARDVLYEKNLQLRESRGSQQKDSPQSGNSSTKSPESPEVNEHNHPSANRDTSKSKSYSSTSSTCQTGPAPGTTQTQSPTPTPVVYGYDIFWTSCHRCKKEYDSIQIFLSQIFICPNCHISLLPTEMPAPMNFTRPPAPATVWAPFRHASHAQMHMSPLPTLWEPSGPYPYGQIPRPLHFIPQMVPWGWGGLGPNTQMPAPQNFYPANFSV